MAAVHLGHKPRHSSAKGCSLLGAARLRERNQVTAHERWTRGISAHSTMQPSQRDAGVAVRTDIVDTIDELVEVVIVYFGRHREASVLALACWRVRCVEFM